MPQWTDRPDPTAHPYALRIIRTPAEKPIVAVVTSLEIIGCRTHFVNNRTVPCEGQTHCHWCHQGHSWRWHGYLACILTESLEHALFEFTATASDTFRNYQLVHGDIRGCKFHAQRPCKRHNGRVVISTKSIDLQRWNLPDPPNVKAILCHIWNVQNTNAVDVGRVRQPFKEVTVTPSKADGRNRPT